MQKIFGFSIYFLHFYTMIAGQLYPQNSRIAECLDFDTLYSRAVIHRVFALWAIFIMLEEGSIRYYPKLDGYQRII